MNTRKHRKAAWAVFAAALALASAAAVVVGRGQPSFKSKSYGQWSAAWMTWLEARGFEPLFEEGDVDCSLGQSGPVWFLAGTGGGPAVRNCAIPAGTVVLYPLINVWWYNEPPEDLTVAEKRIVLDELLSDSAPGLLNSKACLLHSRMDGSPTLYQEYSRARTQSPPFFLLGDRRAIVDGYWVMLALTPGAHTLQFGGALCDFDTGDVLFDVDVTYNLTVE